jgi:hypothetical protein
MCGKGNSICDILVFAKYASTYNRNTDNKLLWSLLSPLFRLVSIIAECIIKSLLHDEGTSKLVDNIFLKAICWPITLGLLRYVHDGCRHEWEFRTKSLLNKILNQNILNERFLTGKLRARNSSGESI